ncbi:MAG: DUF1800 family protein, partial [Verrucomicrobiota bacterium]
KRNAMTATDLQNYIGAHPYRSPTVFNFYYPDFSPSGEIAENQLVAPEFQILDDSIGIRTFQLMHTLVTKGMASPVGNGNNSQGTLDLSSLEAIATDAAALVQHLNLFVCNNGLTEDEQSAIIAAVEALPANDVEERAQRALVLLSIAPSFNTLQ